jgi:hypothetical protein
VVQPTLAIPYFTGVAAFIGNIISLSGKLQNWQQTISNSVLEELQSYLDPIFELPMVGSILEKLSQENSVPASGSDPRLRLLTAKFEILKNKHKETFNKQSSDPGVSIPRAAFRKLNEAEIVVLTKSLWASIRCLLLFLDQNAE